MTADDHGGRDLLARAFRQLPSHASQQHYLSLLLPALAPGLRVLLALGA
eukprot:CAMPEP_0172553328 /NCGR_PEP_ID=MMETSP1067-20121228/50135_1 /TAXON_ID=265564 ORGANISM="Thalassiosira punctigera, Strain Tpunct2005C2" /NCGR_SAMPLE_ID=MMETSP1067 /ASSEMBLY_ACC=CAM_ASM_000444 /LENGTH=48 /DNA_ID= /DNA_START= /DNA_END= /DNA_ORIENTATION=